MNYMPIVIPVNTGLSTNSVEITPMFLIILLLSVAYLIQLGTVWAAVFDGSINTKKIFFWHHVPFIPGIVGIIKTIMELE